jgi:hypothetical protein
MTATRYEFGRSPTPPAAASTESIADDSYTGARRRLTLAVLWLAALVAWGLFSHLAADRGDDPGSASVPAEQPLDGQGKWTGY